MNAYFFEINSREVSLIIKNIQQITTNEVIGEFETLVWLSTEEENIDFIVTDKEIIIGDKIPLNESNFVNKFKNESPEERIKKLEDIISNLIK
ncbi:hypothetical protein P5G61_04040 [Paenibacillus sp. F6_3S_P_1C]|uniref:DUF3006 domain-containing protein n=1 Tax=Paenibacillus vandeheii TaxID=3035917 RepID=A0ABT8J647_9BACL|nr:hypothetical protein [Paenibacillus vandeheii]MDN4600388.1 hypothetical protein [Paenibacillus vandeheii]